MSNLVRIRRYAGNAVDGEIKRRQRESGVAHEDHHESAQTGVHVNGNVVLSAQLGDRLDVVDGAVGEVGCRSDELEANELSY